MHKQGLGVSFGLEFSQDSCGIKEPQNTKGLEADVAEMTDEKQAAPHCDEISPNFVLRYPCMSRRYSVHLAGQLLVLVAMP